MSTELAIRVPGKYLDHGKLMSFPHKCGTGHTFQWYPNLDQCPRCGNDAISPAVNLARQIVTFLEENKDNNLSSFLPEEFPTAQGLESNLKSFIDDNQRVREVSIDEEGNAPLIPNTSADFVKAPLRKFKIGLFCLFGLAVAFITVAVVTSDSSKNDSSS